MVTSAAFRLTLLNFMLTMDMIKLSNNAATYDKPKFFNVMEFMENILVKNFNLKESFNIERAK